MELSNRSWFWLHVPKTGTSLINSYVVAACHRRYDDSRLEGDITLAFLQERMPCFKHTPEYDIDDDAGRLPWLDGIPMWKGPFRESFITQCFAEEVTTRCNFSPMWNRTGKEFLGAHVPLPDARFIPAATIVITMFRKPKERLISAFFHGAHGVARTGMTIDEYIGLNMPWFYTNRNISIDRLEPGAAGAYVRMITGGDPIGLYPIDNSIVEKASQSLTSTITFLGIIEEWDTSILLLHHSFCLGPVFRHQTINIRKQNKSKISIQISPDLVDHADEAVYNHALLIFMSRVKQMNQK